MADPRPCREHGTHRYQAGCSRCQRWQRHRVARNRADRATRLAELRHGIVGTYDAGCRCRRCGKAKAAGEYRRPQRAREKRRRATRRKEAARA